MFNCYLNIFLNIIIFFIFFSINSYSQKDQHSNFYREGISALEKKDIALAQKYFKRSIEESSDVPSLFELSKIYINENTIEGRYKARKILEKAIWKEPYNIDLRLTYASLMENFSNGMAFNEYKKITSIDSECSTAWYNMGRLTAGDFNDYHNSVRNEDGINLSLEQYAEKDFKESENYLINALKYDSLNAEAYLKLSFLYEDAGKPEKGVEVLKRLVKLFPDNKDAHLFLGLLYYKTNEISNSFAEYQDALLIMPIAERLDFTYNSVVELLDPVAEELIKTMKPIEVRNFIDAFWNFRDPLYLTEYNERLLEHYSRVAYANLRFSLPDKPGWKTDRGEIILRYGEPLKRIRYRPQINAGGRTEVRVKTDVWDYEDMTFGFEDSFMSGNFMFAEPVPGSRYIAQFNGDTQAFADYVRRARYESYNPKYEGPAFTIPYNIVQFKNLDKPNNTDVYFNYALNYSDSIVQNNFIKYDYSWGMFFNDDYFNSIYRNKGNIKQLLEINSILTDSMKYAVNSAEMTIRPDSGKLAFEIIRTEDKGVSSNHKKFKAEKFNDNILNISDILVAEKVEKDNLSYPLKRKDIGILPNPTSEFSKKNNLYLYYEVYNLAVNDEDLTDFEQKVTIQKTDDDSGIGSAVSSLLRLVGLQKGEDQITLSSRYQTSDKNSPVFFKLDMNKSKPGKYIIKVNVFDNISKKEAASSILINWH